MISWRFQRYDKSLSYLDKWVLYFSLLLVEWVFVNENVFCGNILLSIKLYFRVNQVTVLIDKTWVILRIVSTRWRVLDSVLHMQPQFVLLQISISAVNHDGRVRRVPCCIGRLSPPSRSSLSRSYERGLTTPRPKRNSRRLKVSRPGPGPAGAALRQHRTLISMEEGQPTKSNLHWMEIERVCKLCSSSSTSTNLRSTFFSV